MTFAEANRAYATDTDRDSSHIIERRQTALTRNARARRLVRNCPAILPATTRKVLSEMLFARFRKKARRSERKDTSPTFPFAIIARFRRRNPAVD